MELIKASLPKTKTFTLEISNPGFDAAVAMFRTEMRTEWLPAWLWQMQRKATFNFSDPYSHNHLILAVQE